jgi:hypothetical protein
MPLDLTDDERAALIELLLLRSIENDRFPLSPRIKRLRAILAKFGIEYSPAEPLPPPKPSVEPSWRMARKQRR